LNRNLYKAVYLIIMNAKNLFPFLTDQDHFFATLVAVSSCMSVVNKEMQYSHKIFSVVFKFNEVIHYVLAVGFKRNWFLVSKIILKFIIHVN
jgi:hypothetical protein